MRIAVFDARRYDRESLAAANARFGHELVFQRPRLERETAILARGCVAACPFVNCVVDAPTLEQLRDVGVRLVALRSAGYNHVDLAAAERCGIAVTRVPAYSPHAVAEHAFALLLALVRRIPRATWRVREANFSLDGLVGVDLHGRTLGLFGTGKIGAVAARIGAGFGMRLLGTDPHPDAALAAATGLRYVPLDELLAESDVVMLHAPLTEGTFHAIDERALARVKPGTVLVNTSRGALVDTRALIDALKRGHLGGAALDVYEEEGPLFFRDRSSEVLQDDVLARLLTFPNVLVTAHQAFLTEEALSNIADSVLASAAAFEAGEALVNRVSALGSRL